MELTLEELRNIVRSLDGRRSNKFVKSLEDRKQKEADFHDRKHSELREAQQSEAMDTYEAIYSNRKYYRAVAACMNYKSEWVRNEIKGKVYLDYCCGIGGTAIEAAKAGATLVIGVDVSAYSLGRAEERAREAGVADRCIFIQADAENTGLPNNCIDRIICNGVLHHLDIRHAFPELSRIMKPGGKALAVEALDYNPAIKAYRMLTPDIRTEWEKVHILSLKDVKFARKYFDVPKVRFWHITGIAGPHLPKFMQPILNGFDRVLEKIPFVQLMAWMFTFEMIKPHSTADG